MNHFNLRVSPNPAPKPVVLIDHVQAVMCVHKATKLGLYESKQLIDNNFPDVSYRNGITGADLGELIQAWFSQVDHFPGAPAQE